LGVAAASCPQRDELAVFKELLFLKLVLLFVQSFVGFLFGCVSGVFGIIIISARADPAPATAPLSFPFARAPWACCHW